MKEKPMKVVLLENIHPHAVAAFEQAGFKVEQHKGALAEAELLEQVKGAAVLGIRSNTKLTAEFFAQMPELLAVGAFCIGTNQIDCDAASEHGVAVFNAPYSNTRSVVELALAEIIALNRRLTDKNNQVHAGVWDKSASGCHEIRGQKLGIVGYGNIGAQLSVIAENLGMEVYYYDIADKLALGNARKCESLDELLGIADIVSVHVDGNPANKGLFGKAQFAQMRPGAVFLNISRGLVVDLAALADALQSGHLAGAGVDVYETEPKAKTDAFITELQGIPNVILTPHIGGSTEEAQANIGTFVARKLTEFVQFGSTALSINLPRETVHEPATACRLLYMHHNVPGALARLNTLLADHGANIEAQYLGTQDSFGYVVTDINTPLQAGLLQSLQSLPEAIRFRAVTPGKEA